MHLLQCFEQVGILKPNLPPIVALHYDIITGMINVVKCLNKTFILIKKCCFFFFQASWFSPSGRTNNPLETVSTLVKKVGSLFTSGQKPIHQHLTVSKSDMVIEEDDLSSEGIREKTEDLDGLETCSLHAASPSHKDSAASDNLRYEAESPDEAALVYAAKAYGFTLLARTPDSVTVRLPSGKDLVFELVDTLAFDSNRKRMSVLVRHPITREYVLYTKGADYAIMELLGTPYAGV